MGHAARGKRQDGSAGLGLGGTVERGCLERSVAPDSRRSASTTGRVLAGADAQRCRVGAAARQQRLAEAAPSAAAQSARASAAPPALRPARAAGRRCRPRFRRRRQSSRMVQQAGGHLNLGARAWPQLGSWCESGRSETRQASARQVRQVRAVLPGGIVMAAGASVSTRARGRCCSSRPRRRRRANIRNIHFLGTTRSITI